MIKKTIKTLAKYLLAISHINHASLNASMITYIRITELIANYSIQYITVNIFDNLKCITVLLIITKCK